MGFTYSFRQIRVFQNFKFENFTQEIPKFQNSKKGMHQVGLNCNFIQNFSSLALKEKAVVVAQISAYATDGSK
jgi:hypothetical protein